MRQAHAKRRPCTVATAPREAQTTKSEILNRKLRESEVKSFMSLSAICSSRREHYISRREHYISQREHYISRRELQFCLHAAEVMGSLFRSFRFSISDFVFHAFFQGRKMAWQHGYCSPVSYRMCQLQRDKRLPDTGGNRHYDPEEGAFTDFISQCCTCQLVPASTTPVSVFLRINTY